MADSFAPSQIAMSAVLAPLPSSPSSPAQPAVSPTPGAGNGAVSSILLSQDQAALLARLTEQLDGPQLWWLSGYAAGLAQARASLAAPAAQAPATGHTLETAIDGSRLTVIYGSQTGNAKRVAETLAQRLAADGLSVRLLRADAYPVRELKDERYLAIVISTQGDGDPPDDARGFVEHILGKRAPKLAQLKFAVLGLGDSSYPQFCAIGRQLDARLAELGGERWLDRVDADLDLDTVATPWLQAVQRQSAEALKSRTVLATVTPLRGTSHDAQAWTRERPFAAELLVNQRITATGKHASDKDIRHLEIGLEGAGFEYEPGDALGVWPKNPPTLVDAVLAALSLDGDAAARHGDQTRPLRDWLSEHRELTRLSRPFIAAHAEAAHSEVLNRLLSPEARDGLTRLLADSQLLDLLRAYPGVWEPDALIQALRPLQPRLYSIASSRKAVGDEAHLTVAHIEYARDGEARWGTASHFLAAAEESTTLPVFLERNDRFRLPTDASRDIVMIGPGTGVAPFRGFVQEREAVGARGRNWLLFGNPHARSDFLYQLEWQDALKRGTLHRLSLAFSRDQAHKVYVQDRLRENGRELYDWLQNGAHLYVCGDATRMAKDVHAALLRIVVEHGGQSDEDAGEFINTLAAQGRYARDVY
jgi:sulfite reductase (NADPH) flavoprotein alpha-component